MINQIPISFPFQSYFSSVAPTYETAILAQPPNKLIVPSTLRPFQSRVSRIGLTGASQTPIAFRAFGKNETGVHFLKPGQAVTIAEASGIEYGLPFGWLGGGISTLVLSDDPNAVLDLGPASRPEIIFHRFRTVIEASAANLPALRRNWPLQFPWTHAQIGTVDQSGAPTIRIEPTRALLRLRSQIALAPDKTVRIVFRGSREFDEASDGTYTLTNLTSTFTEVAFKASTDPALALYPMASIPDDFLRLACDEGGITIQDLGDATLTGIEVDVVRFGRI